MNEDFFFDKIWHSLSSGILKLPNFRDILHDFPSTVHSYCDFDFQRVADKRYIYTPISRGILQIPFQVSKFFAIYSPALDLCLQMLRSFRMISKSQKVFTADLKTYWLKQTKAVMYSLSYSRHLTVIGMLFTLQMVSLQTMSMILYCATLKSSFRNSHSCRTFSVNAWSDFPTISPHILYIESDEVSTLLLQ